MEMTNDIRKEPKNLTPQKTSQEKKEQAQKSLAYQREKDRELVRGIFKNYEVPGGSLEFSFKMYKEDQVENYAFRDGEVYSIPLGVAKHLNKNCYYTVHQHAVDENGRPTSKIGQKIARFGFQSLEFVDIEDLGDSRQIVTVERI